MYLRPHFAGRFQKWGVCRSAQNWPIWKFFNFLWHKIRIQRGSVLWKNVLTHVFAALQCGPFWTNGGVGQSAQTGPILTFENIFLYKIKIQRGYLLWKKLPSHLVRAPCGGPFWSNAWLPTGQIWADQIFFDHFEFKMQNKLGSFLCKKLIRAKMGIVSFGPRPTAIGRIFFIKYFNFVL